MLFDTHCHLDDARFNEDREQLLDDMEAQGITPCITIGNNAATSRSCKALANTRPWLYYTAGVHPHDAKEYTEALHKELLTMMMENKCVAWGEIGLDYYYDYSPRDVQREVFARQLDAATKLHKPVSFHVRDAHEDVMQILRVRKSSLPPGVLHCFSGSVEQAKIYLDMGFHISLAGPVTFNNAKNLQAVVAYVPEDRLLIETDSPYMAPVPVRGKRNDPRNVSHIAKKIAELRSIPYDALCAITRANGMLLFGVSEGS